MFDGIKTLLNGARVAAEHRFARLRQWTEEQLAALDNTLTKKVTAAQSTADTAQSTADAAKTAAATAQSTADTAQSTADAAKTAAATAQSTADTAKTAAATAQSTADTAKTAAATAQSTADGKVSMDDLTSYIELLSNPEKTEAFTENGRTFYKIGIVKPGLDSQANNYDRKLKASILVKASTDGVAVKYVAIENMNYYGSTGSPYYVCYFTNDATFTTYINNKDETVTVQLAFSNDTARSVLAYCSASLGWVSVASVALGTDVLTKINDVDETASNALPKSGGTMTGVLTLKGNPTGDNDAANKKYVDESAALVAEAAENAQTTANMATTAAATAQSTADMATTAAATAQSTADTATTAAATAQSTADTAHLEARALGRAGTYWAQSNETDLLVYGIAHGGGLFVALTGNGIYYSEDGKVWTPSNVIKAVTLTTAVEANGRWTALGGIENLYKSFSSEDGKTWSSNTIGFYGSCMAYADGLWVAGSNNDGLHYSTDGQTWTASNITRGYFRSVAYGDGLWVAAANSVGLYYSEDGKTWTQSNITNGVLSNVIYADGLWVMGMYYSEDGKVWVESNLNAGGGITAYGEGRWTYDGIYYSEDGKVWVESTQCVPTLCNALVYGSGLFVLAGSSGIYYSEDGNVWAKTGFNGPECGTLCYGADLFVVGAGHLFSGDLGRGLYYSERKVAYQSDLDGYISNGDNSIVLSSSTSGSTKKFKITVDDTGALSAQEVTA